jgi:hypothetical protein
MKLTGSHVICRHKGGRERLKLKRGYENGERVIEIIDGNVDVVLFHEKENGSFYFYRFSPLHIFGESISKELYLVNRHNVKAFLKQYDRDYDALVAELIEYAIDNKMTVRYDM